MRPKIWITFFILNASNWASALSLNEFLQQVQSQSPDLRIEKSMNEESSARAQGVRIPPPMVGVMNMKEGSRSNQGIEVAQEIPFPTKILKEKETRKLEAESQKNSLIFKSNEILAQARIAFFDFWSAYEKLEIIKERRSWLKTHLKLARSATRSDSTGKIHLLGIESDVDMLENDVLDAEARLVEKRNSLKVYAPQMNFDQVRPEAPQIEIKKSDHKIKTSNVALKEAELKAAEANKNLKSQSYLPDLFVRYRGFEGNEMTPRNEEIMVGITLPFVFFWQPQSEKSEASARYARAQAELQKVQVENESKINSLTDRMTALEKQLSTLDSTLLPRAHKRMKFVENLSPRTMEGLEEHRTVMLSYLDLKLKQIETRMELEKSLSELIALFGLGGNK